VRATFESAGKTRSSLLVSSLSVSCLLISSLLALCLVLFSLGCSKSSKETSGKSSDKSAGKSSKSAAKAQEELVEVCHYPIDSKEGIITQSGEIDEYVTSDGSGSLCVTVEEFSLEPAVVSLFETGDLDIENATLVYRAQVRAKDVQGQVYLEMWCHFAGRGEFFSRGLMTASTGTTGWVTHETPFFLKAGENPDNVKLNLVIVGKGTAWIDDVRLLKGPLG
jgi:hypothetical protein